MLQLQNILILSVFLAVCTYRLVMISIKRSETALKSALKIQDKFSSRQMQPETKFSLRIFF